MTPEQANDGEIPQGGVLAALPRTRPQRTSSRRAAARTRAQSETATAAPRQAQGGTGTAAARNAQEKAKPARRKAPKQATGKQPSAARGLARKRAPARASSGGKIQERAPKQGYEPEEEIELGATVHPPSSGELIESIAEIFGELASAGASAGGRLLKDALSVFRRP